MMDSSIYKNFTDTAVRLMSGFADDGKSKVGIFWYDPADNALFGVGKGSVDLYKDQGRVVTYPKLHWTYWQKQHHRAVSKLEKGSIFYKEHNYTLIPRGRVFYDTVDDVFYVNVGDWIGSVNIGALRDALADEFNLPDGFMFRMDPRWNIGRGWPEEKLF